MSPPSSVLWPATFNCLRKVGSAMIRETFVLSIWAIIHRNNRAGATSSQRRLSSGLPASATPTLRSIRCSPIYERNFAPQYIPPIKWISIGALLPGTSHLDLDRREKPQIGSDSESNGLKRLRLGASGRMREG